MVSTQPILLEEQIITQKSEINKFRRYLPQTLAALANNLVFLNNGLFDGFPSIVIPSLIGLNTDLNPDETLRITSSQASWIASFAYFMHPIGAFTGWIISDLYGRRLAILLATIPFIIGWAIFSLSHSLSMVLVGFAVIGLGTGLKESASLAYTGEVCETSVRGILLASAAIFAATGYFLVFLLGSWMSWRQTAMIFVAVPICTFLAMIMVPETPIWLISKNKLKKSFESLKWLRGCKSSESIYNEHRKLRAYSNLSRQCDTCLHQEIDCIHSVTIRNKLSQLSRKRILKPFILIALLEFFAQFSGVVSSRAYIFQILNAYAIQMNGHLTAISLSLLGLAARLCLLSIIRVTGKRNIYLVSSIVTYVCCFGLSIFGFIFLPPKCSSFTVASFNSTDYVVIRSSVESYSYLPLALILIMQFFVTIGVTTIPSLLTSEVFPFKYRSMLCCIVSAVRYIFASIASKLYYNIEIWLSLPGAAAFYGCISFIGFMVMYWILPETEGRTLEDIEMHFSNNQHGIIGKTIEKKHRISAKTIKKAVVCVNVN